MRTRYTIAVDAMGGDKGLNISLPASVMFLDENTDVTLNIFGCKMAINKYLSSNKINNPRLNVIDAPESVAMDSSPLHALRRQPESSMRLAIDSVAQKNSDACVSAGNTGALMAISRYSLKLLPKVTRAAIVSEIPTKELNKPNIFALDLGANILCEPSDMLEFAALGSALYHSLNNVENPTIGLLNIGSEENKGSEHIIKSSELFKNTNNINYIGYVEPNHLFDRPCDIIVCDGFSGNIMLKSLEGAAKYILHTIKTELNSSLLSKIKAYTLRKQFQNVKDTVNPNNYNGATIIGLRGIVVKSHGGADIEGFANALKKAKIEVENKLIEKVMKKIASIFN